MANRPLAGDNPASDHDRLLQRRLGAARLVLAWEKLWPAVLKPICVIGVFLAIAWFGTWLFAPRWLRIVGLATAATLLLWSMRDLIRFRSSSLADATSRLDRDAGRPHRQFTASNDPLASGENDPFARELWRRHQERARLALGNIKVARPNPQVSRRDPMALRACILLAVLASAWVAGPERQARLNAAFAVLDPPPPPVPTRLDAWIDTPGYTGRPPIFLTKDAQNNGDGNRLPVPERSVIVVRASPPADISIAAEGQLTPVPGASKAGGDSVENRFTITGDGMVIVRRAGTVVARFPVGAIADTAPIVTLVGRPQRGDRDNLVVKYRGEDDYGIASIEGRFTPLARNGNPVTRSLIPPPTVALAVPPRGDDAPDSETALELGEHAWAGARVALTLYAKDDAGQEGHSETVTVTIPQRIFTDPLAKALVEQRRDLIIDPDHHENVQLSLDALLIAPEQFTQNVGTFLALRSAAGQLSRARTDPELTEVADWLWKIALELEDGGLSEAEHALREAQERLRDALDRNASPEEIRRLTQNLQRAMNQFMREMAERAQRDPNKNAEREDGQRRTITQNDLRKMTQEIEKLAREGKHAEAQRLLEQLNRLMQNMRVARERQNLDPRQREMSDALDELDQMTREQQELRDRTFRQDNNRQGQNNRNQQGQNQRGQQGQNQRGQRQRNGQGQQGGQQPDGQQGEGQQQGQNGEEGQEGQGGQGQGQGGQNLRNRQQALRDQLNRMRERMRRGGAGEQGELGEAEEAMRDAEGSLGSGDSGGAVDAQGRALDKLRQGGQKLAEQLSREGDGSEQADGDEPGDGDPSRNGRQGQDRRFGENGRDSDRDPLGRSRRGQLNPDSRFDGKLGLGPGERANQILEELRRRLGQSDRPALELDYLDRLLRREQ